MLPSELWNYARTGSGGVELSLAEYEILDMLVDTINAKFNDTKMFFLEPLANGKYHLQPGSNCGCKNCERALRLVKKLDAEVTHATQ